MTRAFVFSVTEMAFTIIETVFCVLEIRSFDD